VSVSRLALSFEALYLVLSSLLSIQVTTKPTALSLVLEFSLVNQLTRVYPEQANYNQVSKILQQERENFAPQQASHAMRHTALIHEELTEALQDTQEKTSILLVSS
jgi:hypothetical protein